MAKNLLDDAIKIDKYNNPHLFYEKALISNKEGKIESAYDRYGNDEVMIVTRSNKRANLYNQHIRNRILYMEDELCGGDLSFTSALTFDFEVYSAGQKKWLEVSSVSNFEDYQSNRLKLRYKDSNGKNQLCHTLNGSALALPRIYAALIENNQTPDSIIIPKALQAYTGFDIIK